MKGKIHCFLLVYIYEPKVTNIIQLHQMLKLVKKYM